MTRDAQPYDVVRWSWMHLKTGIVHPPYNADHRDPQSLAVPIPDHIPSHYKIVLDLRNGQRILVRPNPFASNLRGVH